MQTEANQPIVKFDLADAPDEAVGQTLGRYKLLEKVGGPEKHLATALAVSPDGGIVASSTAGGLVRLFDSDKGAISRSNEVIVLSACLSTWRTHQELNLKPSDP